MLVLVADPRRGRQRLRRPAAAGSFGGAGGVFSIESAASLPYARTAMQTERARRPARSVRGGELQAGCTRWRCCRPTTSPMPRKSASPIPAPTPIAQSLQAKSEPPGRRGCRSSRRSEAKRAPRRLRRSGAGFLQSRFRRPGDHGQATVRPGSGFHRHRLRTRCRRPQGCPSFQARPECLGKYLSKCLGVCPQPWTPSRRHRHARASGPH